MRTVSFWIIAVSLFAVGCDDGKRAELEMKNKDLSSALATKDQYVDEMTSSINEIHNQLEAAWSMEKKLMRQTNSEEGGRTLTQAELKQKILSRISDINATLAQNRKRVVDLQHRLNDANTRYTGIEGMVSGLKKTLEEREQSLADLNAHVQSLAVQVRQNAEIIAVRDSTIQQQKTILKRQTDWMNTVFYVVGKRGELKDKGIITNQGGFLWGLLGSTTVLTTTYDGDYFQMMDKSAQSEIEIPGTVDEIVPSRDESSYTKASTADGHTILTITNPDNFWRESRLVIIAG